jgi:hypothetical protein
MANHPMPAKAPTGVPRLERGETVSLPGKQAAKSKWPRACHTIDYDRDPGADWGICGARLSRGTRWRPLP